MKFILRERVTHYYRIFLLLCLLVFKREGGYVNAWPIGNLNSCSLLVRIQGFPPPCCVQKVVFINSQQDTWIVCMRDYKVPPSSQWNAVLSPHQQAIGGLDSLLAMIIRFPPPPSSQWRAVPIGDLDSLLAIVCGITRSLPLNGGLFSRVLPNNRKARPEWYCNERLQGSPPWCLVKII